MRAVRMIVEDSPLIEVPSLCFDDYYVLNRQSVCNRGLIEVAGECGCFHCGSRFAGAEIEHWTNEEIGDDTAQCPYCGEDTVVVGTEEFPLSTALLSGLHQFWFREELKALEERANIVPHFAGYDDYARKGIPFLLEVSNQIEVVGSIKLFNEDLCLEDCCEPPCSVGDVLEREDAQEADDVRNGREPFGGLVNVILVPDECGDCEIRLSDCSGKHLSHVPWSGTEAHFVKGLSLQYGDRLRGIIKNPAFDEMTLVVV